MNRKRGTPPPQFCQRGHDNWRVQKNGWRVCKTCLNMRSMAWQKKEAALWRERRARKKEREAWEMKKKKLKAEIDRLRTEGRVAIERILACVAALEKRL